jgi:hypothetical protein
MSAAWLLVEVYVDHAGVLRTVPDHQVLDERNLELAHGVRAVLPYYQAETVVPMDARRAVRQLARRLLDRGAARVVIAPLPIYGIELHERPGALGAPAEAHSPPPPGTSS